MTVQAANRMWSRNNAGVTTKEGRDRTLRVREGWQVVCDATDTWDLVIGATNLPNIGDIYSGTVSIICKSKTPNQVSPIFWIVEVEYSGEFGPGGVADTPMNKGAEVVWGKVDSTEPTDEDLNGAAIATVNGEPLTGITKQISDITASIKKNYQSVDIPATHAYLHSTNSDVFLGFAAGTGRMTEFSAKEVVSEDNFGSYIEVNATVQFRYPYRTSADKAWYARVRHEGFMVKNAAGVIEQAKEKGEYVVTPVLLKSDGTRETNASSAHWLEFPIYAPLPYNALGLF